MQGQQAEAVKALGALAGIGFLWFSLMAGMFILWVHSLVEVINNDYENNSKTTWILMLMFTGPIGLAFYWFMGRSRKITYTRTEKTSQRTEKEIIGRGENHPKRETALKEGEWF